MDDDCLLPFVEGIARNANLPRHLSRWPLSGIQELHGLLFELGCKPSSALP